MPSQQAAFRVIPHDRQIRRPNPMGAARMGHDIVTFGASAGGVQVLQDLCARLPPGLPASLFVALHVTPTATSVLPQLLSRAGPLPARHAAEGMPIERGNIYVAPPDHHLLLADDRMLVRRGPLENRTRPAADPLFRSAAVAYGPRVVAVVLTGTQDDGAAGLLAVKRCGGTTVVQDPSDAPWPDMPRNAMVRDHVDHVLPLADLPGLLGRLAAQEPGPAPPVPGDVWAEAMIAAGEGTRMPGDSRTVGTPTSLSCPDCGGVLNEVEEEGVPRFRCQVGHAFGAAGLVAAQGAELEHALVLAVRTQNERFQLFRRMAASAREKGHALAAARWEAAAREAEQAAAVISRLLALGSPGRPPDGGLAG